MMNLKPLQGNDKWTASVRCREECFRLQGTTLRDAHGAEMSCQQIFNGYTQGSAHGRTLDLDRIKVDKKGYWELFGK
jgi:hypothetical protein